MGFKFEMVCPCCGEPIVEVAENDTIYRKCTKCEWVGLKFSNIARVEYDNCEYCEVDVDDRKNIFVIETDYVDYEIYVDGNNNLSSDFPFGKKINYCPMCGREL